MTKKFSNLTTNTILLLCIIALYLFIRTQTHITVSRSQYALEDNWTVTVNGIPQDGSSLKTIFFPVTNRGDHLELITTLPDTVISRPTLQFKIYHSAITAYVDDQQVYLYGYDARNNGRMLGSGYHWIPLPDDFAGKELKLCFDVTEDNAYSSVENILLMSQNDFARNFLLNNIIEVVISIFLFAFGILGVAIVLFLKKNDREYRILFWIMLFCICVALWMFSSYGIIQIISRDYNILTYFEYLSLYIAPIPLLLFVAEVQEDKRTKTVIHLFAAAEAGFDILVIVLNELTPCHLANALPLYHILGLTTLILTTRSIILTWKQEKKKSDQLLLRGLGIMVAFIFVDTLRFNIDKYIHPQNINLSDSILPIGVLTFVIIMIASYLYRLLTFFYESVERQTLLQIAYTDALTHVGNRAMCERVFQEHDTDKKESAIINFDLNHFKEVNDTFGHSVGDELLIAFAKILQEHYQTDGFVGRMGGDEFIVVLDNNDTAYIENTISKLLERIDHFNQAEDHVYRISAAYGYCTNKGNPDCSLWEMYKNSDQKMYQHKSSHR